MFLPPITSTLLLTLLYTLTPTPAHASPQESTQVNAIVMTTTIPTTVTTYVASATTPPSPQYTNDLDLRTSVLNSTNYFRFQHNASYLSWNDSLASYATDYAARCIWAHSYGPPGENLARGYPDIISSVDAWGNERDLYTFTPDNDVTGFSEPTGHFTQLVWKSTQTVGCGVYACNGDGGIGGYMLVCEYWPPGNIEGTGSERNVFFDENVQSQVHQGDRGYNEFSATVGASGVGTTWATGTLVPTVSRVSSAGACRETAWDRFGVGVGVVGFGAGLMGGL